MITKEIILKDIKDYGLSQFYTHKGMWSVYEYDYDYNTKDQKYICILSIGNSVPGNNNPIKEEYINISIDEVIEKINKGLS